MPLISTLANASARGYGMFGGAAATNSYESIATVLVGAGGVASVEFTGIPSTFKHLQIRAFARGSYASDIVSIYYQVGNGSVDTGSNYSYHQLYGDGSSVGASGSANLSFAIASQVATDNKSSNIFGASVIDLLEYGNTNTYKTMRSLGGWDANGSGLMVMRSSSWRSTSAINRIKLYPDTGNWNQYSSFALYGIKG